MNWRGWIGLDPAGKTGGVVVHELSGGGELRVDVDALRGRVFSATKMQRLIEQFENYSPPGQRGNPLVDKENKRMHGLYLDDYQPRSHEHGVQRITFERAYPPLSEWVEHDHFMHRPDTDWVDSRNRSPLYRRSTIVLPPMRDALADLLEHLHMVEAQLVERNLVAVEVSVEHEPTLSRRDGSNQGWNFAVHMLAVPQAVLDAERVRHAEYLVKQEADEAETERRRAANR
jgi:hypothetical protein